MSARGRYADSEKVLGRSRVRGNRAARDPVGDWSAMSERRPPRLRKDGRCAQCRGERRPPKRNGTARKIMRELGDVYAADPFCSRLCAMRYYGVLPEEDE